MRRALIGLAVIAVAGWSAACGQPNETPTPPAQPSPTSTPIQPTAAPSPAPPSIAATSLPTASPDDTASPPPAPSATPALAHGPTGFKRTGSMRQRRAYFTATLLLDGRVLVAGGMDQTGSATTFLDTAELYDPATGRFAPAGSMAAPRALHIAVRLLDGRVLVACGSSEVGNGPPTTPGPEVYDPATGTFSPTGSMVHDTDCGTATLLFDGRVLLTGSFRDPSGEIMPSAEVYDPATGTFSPTGAPASLRESYTATLLHDGRVLVAGGCRAAVHGGRGCVARAELYDPVIGAFTTTGAMVRPREYHTATLLRDGRVLLVGGITGRPASGQPPDYYLVSAELYDPRTGTFKRTGSLREWRGMSRWGPTATLLLDGRVLIAGGDGGDHGPNSMTSAEIYDPKTRTFGATKRMAGQYVGATATLLLDGRVLIAGGSLIGPVSVRAAELFQP